MTQPGFDVLSPWSETDPLPLHGISQRLPELRGKRIGLFINNKKAAGPIQDAVEAQLRSRYGDDIRITRFHREDRHDAASNPTDGPRYSQWLKEEVDGVIVAVGD